MITGIEVRRDYSALRKALWRFWFDDSSARLVLDLYQVFERPTNRHGWTVTDCYNRISSRDTTLGVVDVPWDKEIEHDALQELYKRIRVVKEFKR